MIRLFLLAIAAASASALSPPLMFMFSTYRLLEKFRKDGLSVQTSVGFSNAGYGEITWNHARSGGSRTIYKQGKGGRMVHASQGTGSSMKPVPLIANSINSGTTFMKKQPFLRKAFSQSKSAATAAIEAGIKARESELEIG